MAMFRDITFSDKGTDFLGGNRDGGLGVDPPTEQRGRFLWEHQHFFPDDWEVQVRAGWVSDPTFLEYWDQPQYNDGLPMDAEFYVKRQRDTEAITFLAQMDTTPFTTNADRVGIQQPLNDPAGAYPEQSDVQRLPELGYYRIGDSAMDDQLTYFGETTGSRLRFEVSHASLTQQGFSQPPDTDLTPMDYRLAGMNQDTATFPYLLPGPAANGLTGVNEDRNYRGIRGRKWIGLSRWGN